MSSILSDVMKGLFIMTMFAAAQGYFKKLPKNAAVAHNMKPGGFSGYSSQLVGQGSRTIQ